MREVEKFPLFIYTGSTILYRWCLNCKTMCDTGAFPPQVTVLVAVLGGPQWPSVALGGPEWP